MKVNGDTCSSQEPSRAALGRFGSRFLGMQTALTTFEVHLVDRLEKWPTLARLLLFLVCIPKRRRERLLFLRGLRLMRRVRLECERRGYEIRLDGRTEPRKPKTNR